MNKTPLGPWGALASLAVSVALVWLCAPATAAAEQPKPFGIASYSITPIERTVEKVVGTVAEPAMEFTNVPYAKPFTQAGAHPWALTTEFELTSEVEHTETRYLPVPTQDVKDVAVGLPPGLLGDPMAVPRCSLAQATSSSEQCPADTQVGWYLVHLQDEKELLAPIVNVAPEAGQSAEFALENTTKIDTPLLTGHLVRSAQGYGFSVTSNDLPLLGILRSELTFWGVPGEASHDAMRGRFCKTDEAGQPLRCEGGGESFGYTPLLPFLTTPTDCSAGPEQATLRVDSWEEPGSVGPNDTYSQQWKQASSPWPAATGCDLLAFGPTLSVEPETTLADEPTGLEATLSVPLSETPGSLATPQVRDTVVTLPEGLSVNASIVDGIRDCEATGPEGINIEGPESEAPGLNGELQLAAGHCPNASAVGTAEAITPFLPLPIKGHVYLAKPECGNAGEAPCTPQDAIDGKLYRLYLELGGEGELARTGIHFKVPMETDANPATGQLTTRVIGTPQAPFSELKIHLNGGARAPLATPAACGQATTTADLTPWSAPGTLAGSFVPGTPDSVSSSYFKVTGCADPAPLAPGFTAGTVTANAGQFSPFTLNISRQDREQYIKGVQVHTPPGLLGMLSSVPLCGEAQADAGTCSQASKIGAVRVASGAGSHPFEIEGGVYLTGPYDGAPFGLSIATEAVAGPFNLGMVVVRARIEVNPENSTLTITTDETGPYAVPQILDGVPLRLQRITVNIDRPDFMFNPTNCDAQKITATISGSQDATATVSSPFAVGACKSLAFQPTFTASTSGHTSRAGGASLGVKLTYPQGAMGSDANIGRVKVSLPRQLPARQETLKQACFASVFESNPAACPAGSVVGIARTRTPLLPVTLQGPVYFVSHGGAAFPSLVVVLQGDGVRVDLEGSTFITTKGVITSTFGAVPDVPVESFELYLPEGKHPALAANGNLCLEQSQLKMPTEFVAQNGAVLKQSTQIAVTGCSARQARAARTKSRRSR